MKLTKKIKVAIDSPAAAGARAGCGPDFPTVRIHPQCEHAGDNNQWVRGNEKQTVCQ